MTKEEILALYDKAKEYSDKRTENTPDIISRRMFKEALYFAYLEGAGLNILTPMPIIVNKAHRKEKP